ncbi:hypothetical protein B0H13DRAFT_1874214 [Mycena leptocephala]|nr:hypothetical protein B0H13DRAFT_1874214 [Mycena leptocephala]
MVVKNVHQLNPLSVGNWAIMWNSKRFYVGEILDILKQGANSRYGSISSSSSVLGLSYLSLRNWRLDRAVILLPLQGSPDPLKHSREDSPPSLQPWAQYFRAYRGRNSAQDTEGTRRIMLDVPN